MKKFPAIVLAILCAIAVASTTVAANDPAPANPFVFFEPGPTFTTTNYYDHTTSEMETQIVTTPFTWSDLTVADATLFKQEMQAARQRFVNDRGKIVISGETRSGLNIVYNCDASVPSAALTALETTAQYLENLFSDPITITVDIDFAPLGSGVLGGTSVYYTASTPTWTTTRNGLVAGMDSDDYIQPHLPSTSTIPVRYDGSSATVTNENQCIFSLANYAAAIGTAGATSGATTFSSQMSWDYDPSNGVSGGSYCFQSVALHEVGHVLGFVSRAESWYDPASDIIAMDIYRFQRTDGTGDFNPDNVTEFGTCARLVDYNNPGDDHNTNLFTSAGLDVEYRMSDGTPYQASHFRQGSVAGIMQPAVSSGATFYPNFYRDPDIAVFDAIGWDYPANSAPLAPSNPVPADLSINIERGTTLSWTCSDPDAGDVLTYDVYLGTSFPPGKVSDRQSAASYVPTPPLSYNKQYYWRVVAWDSHNGSNGGPLWSFATAPLCGDADASFSIDISDAVYLIAYIFSGGPAPSPLSAGDATCDGAVDISDAVYLIAYIFSGGPAPCAECKK